MINLKFGEMPDQSFNTYFDYLIGKTYKILPMREEKCPTLEKYLENYERELIGNKELITVLSDEPRFITVISTIQYLIDSEYSTDVCRKEVFKCIRILEEIKNKYFAGGELNG